MGLCFLCSHCFASAWLLLTIAANAAAATANFALVFLAGDPLLPTTVVGSKLATSLVTLFGVGLVGMTVTSSLKVTFGLCGITGSCVVYFSQTLASVLSAALRYILLGFLKSSMVLLSVPCVFPA